MRNLLIRSSSALFLGVFAISFVLFSVGIGCSSIYILDESKNAQCAWEMMHGADPVVPTFNEMLRTDKPPLHYYAMMGSYALLGKTALAARLPSALMGALLMGILALFVRRFATMRVTGWTVAVLLSSLMWITEFHLAVPDPYLITLVALGLMAFFHHVQTGLRWSIWAMYAAFSLGVLAKGPVAVALPGVAVVVFMIYTRRFRWDFIKKLQLPVGILIAAALIVPWYYLAWKHTDGEWLRGFLFDHNIGRFANTKEGHGGTFLVTWGYFVLGLLPFVAFGVGAIGRAIRHRHSDLTAFSAIVVLVFVAFFSVSRTKLPNYTMPCFPFMAILLAEYLADAAQNGTVATRNVRGGYWFLLVVAIAIVVGLTVGVRFEPLVMHIRTLGLWLVFLPVGVAIAFALANRRRVRTSFFVTVGSFVLAAVTIWTILIPKIDRVNPVAQTLPLLRGASTVAYHQTINPSYIFYYGPIRNLKDTLRVREFLGDPHSLLITSERKMGQSPAFWSQYEVVYKAKDIFDSNVTVILRQKR